MDTLAQYRKFLRGDNDGLNALVAAYSDALVRYAYCFVKNCDAAEDIMEDALAALVIKRKSFDSERAMSAYLFRTAKHKSIDFLRKKGRTVSIDELENVLTSENSDSDMLNSERNRTLYACMQRLPRDYADVLFLTYIQGFSADEVTGIIKKNKKQVYNLLARAKAALKEILINEGFNYEDV